MGLGWWPVTFSLLFPFFYVCPIGSNIPLLDFGLGGCKGVGKMTLYTARRVFPSSPYGGGECWE